MVKIYTLGQHFVNLEGAQEAAERHHLPKNFTPLQNDTKPDLCKECGGYGAISEYREDGQILRWMCPMCKGSGQSVNTTIDISNEPHKDDPFAAIRTLPATSPKTYRPCDKCGKQSAWVYEALFYRGQYLCYDCISKTSQTADTAALNALKREQEEAAERHPQERELRALYEAAQHRSFNPYTLAHIIRSILPMAEETTILPTHPKCAWCGKPIEIDPRITELSGYPAWCSTKCAENEKAFRLLKKRPPQKLW